MMRLRDALRHAEDVVVSDLRDEDTIARLKTQVQEGEARARALEGERDAARAERDAAMRELAELRTRVARPVPIPVTAESSRAALVNVVEAAVTGRAAEALRRRATEELLMGVAAREQAYRANCEQNQASCSCYQRTAVDVASTPPLPAVADTSVLRSTVDVVLKSLSVGQPVNLDSHHIADYYFSDAADRELVNQARQTGRQNAATYRILESGLALNPRATAEAQVRRNWPFPTSTRVPAIMPAVAQRTLVTMATPPVALEETVTTADDDADLTLDVD